MSDKANVRMTVKYVNGEEEHYQFNRQEMDEIQLTRKTQEALESQFLIIELENKVQLIPFNNVSCIEISPPGEKLPQNCILGAKLV